MAEREIDVVVFGATSVTGRRVAAYLAERVAARGARWAAAARSAEKLERVLAEEGVEAPARITADIGDAGSLRAMAERAEVVVNLVGPYTLYGEAVIAACVDGGAHYVDLTGEIPFARRMLDRYGSAAEAAGVKIVQTCGFESLPPDLTVRLAAEAARERHGEELAEVDLAVAVTGMPSGMPRLSDGMSGGTMQSMAEVTGGADAGRLTDPALLIEDVAAANAVRARSPIRLAPRRGRDGSVLAPMSPAAFINPAVIHRSALLAAEESGEPFTPFEFREGVAMPGPAPVAYAAAGMLSAVQAAMAAVARARPGLRTRASNGMRRVLPGAGFGPRADRLEDWRWRVVVNALTASGASVEARADAEGHPGYLATARMIGEAGLLLAEPGATPSRAGFLTPATALGTASAERFASARLRFGVA